MCFFKLSHLSFSRKSYRKKEKSVVSFTREQKSICSQIQSNDIADEHTIICRAVICRSRGGLSANEKEETFASNDKAYYAGYDNDNAK